MRMQYYTTDLEGLTLVNPDRETRLGVLQAAAKGEGADYPEVYLSMDDGTVLGYRSGGILFQEDDGEVVRLIRGLEPAQAGAVWTALIDSGPEALEGYPWEAVDD